MVRAYESAIDRLNETTRKLLEAQNIPRKIYYSQTVGGQIFATSTDLGLALDFVRERYPEYYVLPDDQLQEIFIIEGTLNSKIEK